MRGTPSIVIYVKYPTPANEKVAKTRVRSSAANSTTHTATNFFLFL